MRQMIPRYIEVVNISDTERELRDVGLSGGLMRIGAGQEVEITREVFRRVWRRNASWLQRTSKAKGAERKRRQATTRVAQVRSLWQPSEESPVVMYEGEEVTVTKRTPTRVYFVTTAGERKWTSSTQFDATEEAE